MGPPDCSLIISVYRDSSALSAILEALRCQSINNAFEIIVSDDGEDADILTVTQRYQSSFPFLTHLRQPDIGFQKNKALNRAIASAKTEKLLFIDGDCVPAPGFIEGHLKYLALHDVCAGRRVELGKLSSKALRTVPRLASVLGNRFLYIAFIPFAILDGSKNVESGIRSSTAQIRESKRAHTPLLGCNFSARKSVLEDVNGFNEDYSAPGLGEDSDLECRLRRAGYSIVSVNFAAPLFHLHHERDYGVSNENNLLFQATQLSADTRCKNGLTK